ncbi:anti-phage protein Ppl [Thalassomonas sp. M1454]|uniref:anti-phage protein Ppl n=1 Tax=Thalassomonas sp. M1454 TaxID=2594477 RepID=UPI00117FCE03|nr:anti-phage protein Ppl [Thalassomonas sp. M1454]TRX52741.1 AAA family ATPase [Thalassomonas sp. M1454]
MSIKGSKWFKVDFHCHSPASDDFPRSRDKDVNVEICSEREWLTSQMAKGLDCVVLADHNTGAWVDKVRAELETMKAEYNDGVENGFRELIVLPAVELTATGNCHVLAIFEEKATSQTISELVGSCNLPKGQYKNHNLELGYGVRAILSNIRQASVSALSILAHVDKPKGIFQNSNQESVKQVFAEGPDAIELIGNRSELDKYQQILIDDLAWVKGSDAHSLEEMGRSFTWVKMVEPSFEGIKTALSDPIHCIKRSPETPPSLPNKRIVKLSLKTNMCRNEHNDGIDIQYSPWYSAIVGSRGSGKSTLVEAIRLGLRRDTELPSYQQKKIQSFKSIDADGVMSKDSFIEIEYEKDNSKYLLTWSPESRCFYHKDKQTDKWLEEDTFSTSRFPVSIYSQKMLYEIATKPNSFLKVIDESVQVNYSEWDRERLNLEEQFKLCRNNERKVVREINALTQTKGELQDVKRKLQLLNKSGLNVLQEKIVKDRSDLTHANAHKGYLDTLFLNLKEQYENSTTPTITTDKSDLQAWQTEIKLIVDTFVDNIGNAISTAEGQLDALCKGDFYTKLTSRVDENEELLKAKIQELESDSISPDELTDLIVQEAELEEVLAGESGMENKLSEATQQRVAAYKALIKHRLELTNKRQKFITDLGLSDLDIQILPLACSSKGLVEGYQKSSGVDRFTTYIFDSESPNSLLYGLEDINKFSPKSPLKRLIELTKLKHFHAQGTLSKNYSNIHGSLRSRLSELPNEVVDNIFCWFPEDGLQIKFKDPDGQFRQLERASPGQKSASMLSFLMSYGDDPLILDQPEDDLDCGMLSSSVIPAIAKNKQKRQLIVVTHSAPIVVNGDAELVIGMKQDRQRLAPCIDGGLQEESVKNFICTQMEGGEKAFKSRYKRIIG